MKTFIVGDTGLLDGLALWGMADDGDVLLYTDRDILPVATSDELMRLAPDEIVIVGGTARVSEAVALALNAIAPTRRVAGASRFQTAVEVAQETHPLVAPPETGTIFWSDGFESGDIRNWKDPAKSTSGNASQEIVTSPTRSGGYALKLANWNVDGTNNAGIRMTPDTEWWRPVESGGYPDDMHYSVWYHIPFAYQGKSNAFQYKMSDAIAWNKDGTPREHTQRMIWKISFDYDPSGKYKMEMATRVRQATGEWAEGSPDVLHVTDPIVPVGEWFHVEVRYVWGKDGTGATTVWLNGVEVWDRQGYSTEANNLECYQWCRTWAVNHYLGDWQGPVTPADSWMFIDDAKIADYRVGVD